METGMPLEFLSGRAKILFRTWPLFRMAKSANPCADYGPHFLLCRPGTRFGETHKRVLPFLYLVRRSKWNPWRRRFSWFGGPANLFALISDLKMQKILRKSPGIKYRDISLAEKTRRTRLWKGTRLEFQWKKITNWILVGPLNINLPSFRVHA